MKGAGTAINVNGLENSIIDDITLNDVSIEAKTAGQINYSSNWRLNNVKIITEDSTKVSLNNITGIDFPNSVYQLTN